MEQIYKPVCVQCEDRPRQSPCVERFKLVMITLGFVMVILNFSLTLYTLNAIHGAQAKLVTGTAGFQDLNDKLTSLNTVATQIMDFFSPSSRLSFNMFPISIPNLLNEVLRMDFNSAAVNVTKFAKAVEAAMRRHENEGQGMDSVAQYSSLVASVAQEASYLKRVTNPKHKPVNDTDNNDIMHFFFSGLFNIIDFEAANPEPWGDLANTCMDFVDNFLAVNWSGVYRGEYNQRLTWNINRDIDGPFRSIFDYCQALSNLTSPDSVKEFFLTDLFD